MMKILLPIDIVHQVKVPLEQLIKLVKPGSAEILLLYVKDELPSYERVLSASGDFSDDWEREIEKKADQVFAQITPQLSAAGYAVNHEIVTGPPAMMIEAVARDEHFDMTIVTPGRHSRVELFLLGSVTSAVVKHTPGTIVISRPQQSAPSALSRVVMGIDGSDQSHQAVKKAAEQFHLTSETQVVLIHVATVADVLKLVSPVEYIAMVENNLLLEGETFLAEGKKILADCGVTNVDCVLKEGDPSTEIIKLASEMQCDLIVAGAQGRTAIQHFLLGSVSHRIAMLAPCSVAIVKPSGK